MHCSGKEATRVTFALRSARLGRLDSICFAIAVAIILVGSSQTLTQPVEREFRGAWIATVLGLDWPDRTYTTAQQQQALRFMLDRLKRAGINAVFFQVRSESDAMYASPLEPWSYWLTGEQGKPPQPFYDPLAYAIEQAHLRGIELHAWINPYRAQRAIDGYQVDSTHATVRRPEWILTFENANIRILNPGMQDVRDYVTSVVMDVVRRYDIDGIHFDDYFYPYPDSDLDFPGIRNEDKQAFLTDPRGYDEEQMGDWRRENVDLLVQQVADSIRAAKPHVKFGISPFGIRKNGEPPGVCGFDAYNNIYADPLSWLDNEWIDYIVPQLYWAFGAQSSCGSIDYATLGTYWSGVTWTRHLYTGHGLYRTDANTYWGTLFAPDEIPRQIRYNRGDPNIRGSVFFRARNISQYLSQGILDSLSTDLFATPVLPPSMDWLDRSAPAPPTNLVAKTAGDSVTLSWTAVERDAGWMRYTIRMDNPAPAKRAQSASEPSTMAATIVAITGDTTVAVPVALDGPMVFTVSAASRNAIESEPGAPATAPGRDTMTRFDAPADAVVMSSPYPNPFSRQTHIEIKTSGFERLSAEVFDQMGRRVRHLQSGDDLSAGNRTLVWSGETDAGGTVAAGMYVMVITWRTGQKSVPVVYMPHYF